MTGQAVRDAIDTWVHDCRDMLAADPNLKKVTAEMVDGSRIVVSRSKVKLGPKGALVDVSEHYPPEQDRWTA